MSDRPSDHRGCDGSELKMIHAYSRAQAIADGTLVDVSDTARQIGLSVPVALTLAAWSDTVEWDPDNGLQDEEGRVWDVVWMAAAAAHRSRDIDRASFAVYRIPNRPIVSEPNPERIPLQLVIGPGDAGEPVVTIMLPGED